MTCSDSLVHFIAEAHRRLDQEEGVTLNVGQIQGGTAINIVPDLAIAKINVRADHDLAPVLETLQKLTQETTEGTQLKLVTHTNRPVKPFDAKTEMLFEAIKQCGKELGQSIQWEPSGGVCDGNFLAAAGLPTADTLGAIGGNIHTFEEYIELSSLESRSALVSSFLTKLALREVIL